MAEYEKDFVLRQAKQAAEMLGAFLDKKSVDQIIKMDEAQGDKIKEDEQGNQS